MNPALATRPAVSHLVAQALDHCLSYCHSHAYCTLGGTSFREEVRRGGGSQSALSSSQLGKGGGGSLPSLAACPGRLQAGSGRPHGMCSSQGRSRWEWFRWGSRRPWGAGAASWGAPKWGRARSGGQVAVDPSTPVFPSRLPPPPALLFSLTYPCHPLPVSTLRASPMPLFPVGVCKVPALWGERGARPATRPNGTVLNCFAHRSRSRSSSNIDGLYLSNLLHSGENNYIFPIRASIQYVRQQISFAWRS